MSKLFFQYARDVLGFRYWPEPQAPKAKLIVFDLPNVGGLGKDPLFVKMMEAIGLKLSSIHIIECLPKSVDSVCEGIDKSLPVLCFAEEFELGLKEKFAMREIFFCHGPRDLKVQPELKKKTWAELQKLKVVL
jgi:hypothetical protein